MSIKKVTQMAQEARDRLFETKDFGQFSEDLITIRKKVSDLVKTTHNSAEFNRLCEIDSMLSVCMKTEFATYLAPKKECCSPKCASCTCRG